MTEIDHAIEQVEHLYRSLTGHDAPVAEAPYAPIPPERDPVDYVDAQVERLLMALAPLPPVSPALPWTPPITVRDSDAEMCIDVDLPGVPREAASVSVTGNLLVVSGHREPVHDTAEWRVAGSERPFGAFRRVLALPDGVALDRLTAEMKSGVLEIRVPRVTPTNPEPVVVPVQ